MLFFINYSIGEIGMTHKMRELSPVREKEWEEWTSKSHAPPVKKMRRLFKGKAKPDKAIKNTTSLIESNNKKLSKSRERYDRIVKYNKMKPTSYCSVCGSVVNCKVCNAKYNAYYIRIDEILNDFVKNLPKKYVTKQIVHSDKFNMIEILKCELQSDIKFKIVGMDRKSLFTTDRHYKLEYIKDKIIRGIQRSYGISCFDTLENVRQFLREQSEDWNDNVREDEYQIVLVRGIGNKHVSYCESDRIDLREYYHNYPPELVEDRSFVGQRQDDFDFRYTPKGTSWYDKVVVLT